MPRVAVDVMLKREIRDPQGQAVERALPSLGFAASPTSASASTSRLTVSAATASRRPGRWPRRCWPTR